MHVIVGFQSTRALAERLLQTIRTLSSPGFEGRAPGSRGEKRTIDYLEAKFREIGLSPGAPGGGYRQPVPLVGITPDPAMRLSFLDGKESLAPRYGEEFVAWTKRLEPQVSVDAPVVFAGYGIAAPEYDWDDFAGVDVHGKVLMVLVGDPPVEGKFRDGALTYYGRWTYKLEKAAAAGAVACLIVHRTDTAGYPWEVVRGGWTGEQFDLRGRDPADRRLAVEGWISRAEAEHVVALAGRELASLEKAAATPGFRALPLGIRARIHVRSRFRNVDSANLIGRIAGSDAERSREHIVYMAHWDHFGVRDGKVFAGAVDNASGVAGLLELARAFVDLGRPSPRSVLFLTTTAEEQGLLGSRYYAEHPAAPLASTVAAINLDGMNVHGRTTDVVLIGRGLSTADDLVERAARRRRRRVVGDPEPEKGYFFRSDHFSLAKKGVPAIHLEPGVDFIGKPPGWGLAERKRYVAEDYHKPSDVVREDWDLAGAIEDLDLLFDVGREVATRQGVPEWKPGAEFHRPPAARPAD
ncbi:MAG: hypothetical protein QOD06_1587 [Candidatus Binatota bacterium]|nr:hypothetical protein [Candidatus Binatota bacterium]